MDKPPSLLHKIFKDKHGRWALTAAPNWPLMVWAVAVVASHIFKHGAVHSIFSFIGLVAIILWALLEIFWGVSYFRRGLGLVVLAITIHSHFF
jgi:hypothetical protein